MLSTAAGSGERRSGAGSAAIVMLAVLASLYTMYFAASLLIPVVAALLLYFLLEPVVRWLMSCGLSRSLGTILVTAALLGFVGGGLYQLSEPGARWLRDAPTSLAEFRAKLRSRPNPLEDVRNASQAVEEAVAEITGSDERSVDEARAVQIRQPGALETVLSRLPLVAGSALVTIVLTLFLLIFGDRLQRRIVACGRTFAARRRIVVVLSQVQSDLTRYLGTITLINLGLGVVVAGVMFWLGLPNPVLWGAVACVLNFAPYIGAMLTAATLLLVGFSSFDTVPQMLGPALAFLGLTIVEGQFLTPMLLGHRLELSPLVVFVAVMTLGWLWGLVGALLAVPIVASVRIILGGAPGCRPLARLLAR